MYSLARTLKDALALSPFLCLKFKVVVIFILPFFVFTFPFFQAAMIGNVEPPPQAQVQQQNIMQFVNQVSSFRKSPRSNNVMMISYVFFSLVTPLQ